MREAQDAKGDDLSFGLQDQEVGLRRPDLRLPRHARQKSQLCRSKR